MRLMPKSCRCQTESSTPTISLVRTSRSARACFAILLPHIVRQHLRNVVKLGPAPLNLNHGVDLWSYTPAMAGGIFGMIGGYLTDLFGRRRILVWSILMYAFSALAAGYATSLPMLLFLRCTTFVGVSVEFVAAVAWLAGLFPDAQQPEAALGYPQPFSPFLGTLP